jgi:hypothetical protein
MKEKKRLLIDFTDIVKKALEAKDFKVEYHSDKFDPKRVEGKTITLGFLKRYLKKEKFIYGDMAPRNIMSIDGDSINIFNNDLVMVTMFSHTPIEDHKQPIDKFEGIISIMQDDLEYTREKDGLMFNLEGIRKVKAKGWDNGWHDFLFKIEYYIEKNTQEIIRKEFEEMEKIKNVNPVGEIKKQEEKK